MVTSVPTKENEGGRRGASEGCHMSGKVLYVRDDQKESRLSYFKLGRTPGTLRR